MQFLLANFKKQLCIIACTLIYAFLCLFHISVKAQTVQLGTLVQSVLSQPKLPLTPLFRKNDLTSRFIPQPALQKGKWELSWFSEGAMPLNDLLYLAGHTVNGYWVDDGKIVTTPTGGIDELQETILRIATASLDAARYQELSQTLARTTHRLSPLKNSKHHTFWETVQDRLLRMQTSQKRAYRRLTAILGKSETPPLPQIVWSDLYQPVVIPNNRRLAVKQALEYQFNLAPMLGEGIPDPLLASPITSSHRREKQTLSFDKAKIDGGIGSRVGGFSTLGAKLQMQVPFQTRATTTSLHHPTDWVSQKLGTHQPRETQRKWLTERIAISYDALVAYNRDTQRFAQKPPSSNHAHVIIEQSERSVSAINARYASYFAKLQILAALGHLSEQLLSRH